MEPTTRAIDAQHLSEMQPQRRVVRRNLARSESEPTRRLSLRAGAGIQPVARLVDSLLARRPTGVRGDATCQRRMDADSLLLMSQWQIWLRSESARPLEGSWVATMTDVNGQDARHA